MILIAIAFRDFDEIFSIFYTHLKNNKQINKQRTGTPTNKLKQNTFQIKSKTKVSKI